MSDKTDPKERDLVSVGSKALTTKSSALVKRGLEALASLPGRIIRFPVDRSMGEFCLYYASEACEWADGADARGEVTVPAQMELMLSLSEEAVSDLSPLRNLKPDDIDYLYVGFETADDRYLSHIEDLTGLKGLC